MPSIVYVLTNPAMPGIVKIGVTSRQNPSVRMNELYTTGVPLPFECVAALEVGDDSAGDIETALHTAFAPQRVNPAREFFEIEPYQVEALLRVLPGRDVTPKVNEAASGLDPVDREAVAEFKGRRAMVTEQDFLGSLDENGLPVFNRILAFGRQEGLRINWGFKGFSMNVDLNGNRFALCFGYPPNSMYGQSIYTDLGYSIAKKAGLCDPEVQEIRQQAIATEAFTPVGGGIELCCRLDRNLPESQAAALLDWLQEVTKRLRQNVVTD